MMNLEKILRWVIPGAVIFVAFRIGHTILTFEPDPDYVPWTFYGIPSLFLVPIMGVILVGAFFIMGRLFPLECYYGYGTKTDPIGGRSNEDCHYYKEASEDQGCLSPYCDFNLDKIDEVKK